MGKRREARERAVQFLFQHDLSPPEDLERALEEFWQTQRAAAIAEEKGPATWGQPTELPPPTSEEAETRLFAENTVGLRRHGHTPESIASLHKAFRLLSSKTLNTTQALERIRAEVAPCPELDDLLEFIATAQRGFIK